MEKMNKMGITRTVKTYKEGSFSCGIMFKHVADYNFFRPYFTNNYIYLQSCNCLRMNTQKQLDNPSNIFGTTGDGVMDGVLYYSLGVLGLALLVGAVVEGRRFCCVSEMRDAVPCRDEDARI